MGIGCAPPGVVQNRIVPESVDDRSHHYRRFAKQVPSLLHHFGVLLQIRGVYLGVLIRLVVVARLYQGRGPSVR